MSKKPTAKQRKESAEDALHVALLEYGLSPEREHEFCSERKWRLDFAWPEIKLAIEVHGAGFGHQSHKGRIGDMEKQNAATEYGWRLLVYPAGKVSTAKRRERIVEQIRRIICGVECPQSAAIVLVGD